MKAMKSVLWSMLLLSSLAFAAGDGGKKQVDVDPVDVPEKMVVQPTPAEIHEDNTNTRSCESCHTKSDQAEPKPMNHFLTTKDCGACHFSKSWVPLKVYQHLTGRYPGALRSKPDADPQECRACHISNSEYLAR